MAAEEEVKALAEKNKALEQENAKLKESLKKQTPAPAPQPPLAQGQQPPSMPAQLQQLTAEQVRAMYPNYSPEIQITFSPQSTTTRRDIITYKPTR